MSKTNILLLIADKHLAEIYATKFKTAGWHSVCVTTVPNAKKELKKKRISAMITDGQIGVMDSVSVPIFWLVDQLDKNMIVLSQNNPSLKLIRKKNMTPTSLIKFIRSIL